ncbi:MAG: tol-pal system-associated acyl-CoA thioesterase [Rhodobacteraceae bacterium PARR1]|nr:MAG: tol-pal system-associated acyl-CoA thioesterase [Rhodobacteraceae bacterium PARR1]
MTSEPLTMRVYYEDTDLAGIVYYANYLKFIERGRTEFVRARGVDQGRLKAEEGIVFAVRRVEADYLSPARFDDLLMVETVVAELKGASIVMDQSVTRAGVVLFRAKVTLVCLNDAGRAQRMPDAVRAALAG